MFLPSSSIAFLFSSNLTRRLTLFSFSPPLASTLASLISSSAMVCSCRFLLPWPTQFFFDTFFLSFLVCSFCWSLLVLQVKVILCRAWLQDVSSSINIESSIGPSCCLTPSYALRITINEFYCMLSLRMSLFSENPLSTQSDCPCEKKSAFAYLLTISLRILASFQYDH